MKDYKKILGLKYAGMSKTSIAERLGCGWHTVDRCVRKVEERGSHSRKR